MRALVFTAPERLEMQDVPEPQPADGQTIVEVASCGICGSDMHAWHGHDPRRVPPLVLGHEAVGIALDGPHAGRRVAINPLMTCGKCDACQQGRSHLCTKRELIGMRVPGAFAERVAIRTENLTPLPDALPHARAVVAEPLACAVHTVALGLDRAATPPSEQRVRVLGGGAIGLLCALVLEERGAGEVMIAETNPLRRERLGAFVAGAPYDPAADDAESAADLVIDAVGSGRSRAAAARLTRPGGTIVHIGLQDDAAGLDTRRLTLQEISFIGSYCYTTADFAKALELLTSGAIDPAPWSVTRSLEDGPASFRDIDDGRAPPKIVLSIR